MPTFSELIHQAVRDKTLVSLRMSGPDPRLGDDLKRVTIRPVMVKRQPCYQVARRIGRQEQHENLSADRMLAAVEPLFPAHFRECQLVTTDSDYHLQRRPNGSVHVRRKEVRSGPVETSHDRRKQYLIPERQPCAFLEAIGVMRPDGQVRASRYAKFRQINRFLELVHDVRGHLPKTGPIRVIDFGCGKSYLTFALHHLFTQILRREVILVGLDRDPSVINTCREIKDRLELEGLEFSRGEIAGYRGLDSVDLVVSLHACDTATDAALAQAIRWEPEVILSVPCCQHELAPQLNQPALSALLNHGILRERFAALATDALRAAVLEQSGYSTQVVEFIDLEHTAKNLMLRAIRGNSPAARQRATEQVDELLTLLGVNQFALQTLLAGAKPGDQS